VAKAAVCKTAIPQFESGCRLHNKKIMTHQQKVDVADLQKQLQKIKFLPLLEMAFNLFLKNWQYLLSISVVCYLIIAVIDTYVFPPIISMLSFGGVIGALLGMLLQILVSMVLGVLAVGVIIRVVKLVHDGGEIIIPNLVTFAKNNAANGIKLCIDLIIYNGYWMILVYEVALLVLTLLALGNGTMLNGPMTGLVTFLASLFPIACLIWFVVFFKKIIGSAFAFWIFYSSDTPKREGALEKSVKVAENLTWTIFANIVLISLVTGLVGAVISMILTPFFAPIGWGFRQSATMMMSTGSFQGALVSGLVTPLLVAFVYKLIEQAEKTKRA
jgi:hypothetical protein